MFRPRHFAAALFKPRLFPGGGGAAVIAAFKNPRLFMRNVGRMMNP